jgi:hypothetical protein
MTKALTLTIEQPDLFGGPATVVAVVERRVLEVTPAKPKRRTTATQRASHDRMKRHPKAGSARQIIQTEIKGNWKLGRTRQEIADRTGIKLQTVCGCVADLLKCGTVFEPVVSYDDNGRPVKWQRDGRAVLVDQLYQATWDLTSAVARVVA